MPIKRINEYEIPKESEIFNAYARRMEYIPNSQMTVQEYVTKMINRAGAADYIKMINSQLKETCKKEAAAQITSVLQIPEIKSAIDKAIDSKKYTNITPLLVELQSFIKLDKRIPEDLKNVIGDANLKKYISERMQKNIEEKVQYDLGSKKDTETNDANSSYFSFDSNDKKV